MELTEAERQKIEATHDMAREIKIALCGINGKGGLIDEVKTLVESHYKLKRHFWILVGILAGLGILSGGLWGILG